MIYFKSYTGFILCSLLIFMFAGIASADCVLGDSKCGVDGQMYSCARTSMNIVVWKKNSNLDHKCKPAPYAFSSSAEMKKQCTEGDKKCDSNGMIHECIIGGVWFESQDKCESSAMADGGIGYFTVRGGGPPRDVQKNAKSFIEKGEYDKAEQEYLRGYDAFKKSKFPTAEYLDILEGLASLYNSQGSYDKAKPVAIAAQHANEKLLISIADIPQIDKSNDSDDPELNDNRSVKSFSQASEIDTINNFLKSFNERIASQAESYKAELISVGFVDVLATDKLRSEKSLMRSLVSVADAKRIAQKFKEETKNNIENGRVELLGLPVNEELKQKISKEFDYAAPRLNYFSDAIWDFEYKIISECQTALKLLLENKSDWNIDNNKIIFNSDLYSVVFNGHIAKIDNFNVKETRLLMQYLKIFSNRMQLALK
jgi:hypothetical protein